MVIQPAEGNNKAVSALNNVTASRNPTRLLTATLCTLIFQYRVIMETIRLVAVMVSITIIKKLPHPNRLLIITQTAM